MCLAGLDLDQAHRDIAEPEKRKQFTGLEAAGIALGDAERAQRMAIGIDQRNAGIGTQKGLAGDERIVCEARVAPRIGHDQRLEFANRVIAEGGLAPYRGQVDSMTADNVLLLGAYQGDEAHGCAHRGRRGACDDIQGGLGAFAQQATAFHRRDTCAFQIRHVDTVLLEVGPHYGKWQINRS